MTWFDPTLQGQPSTPPEATGVGGSAHVHNWDDANGEPTSVTTAVNEGDAHGSNPSAAPPETSVPSEQSAARQDSTAGNVEAAGRQPKHAAVPVDGTSRRRKLAVSAVVVAAAVAFLCWPRGEGYTPSLPVGGNSTVEQASTTPTGTEAAEEDQAAAASTWSETGSWQSFAPVSGNVTWMYSGDTVIVFRTEAECFVYAVVGTAPSLVQTQPVQACSDTAVGEAREQLDALSGEPVTVSTVSADSAAAPDTVTSTQAVVGSETSGPLDVLTSKAQQAQQWGKANGTFAGFYSDGVVVLDASGSSITLTTDGATGCPAVNVTFKQITAVC